MDKLALERAFAFLCWSGGLNLVAKGWMITSVFTLSNHGQLRSPVRSPHYEVINVNVWTFYFKYLNIKKNLLIAMSLLFKCIMQFKLHDAISQHHVPFNVIIFNITIQIISITLTTLMERRAKFWWAAIWRTEMRGVRSVEKRRQTGL